MSEELRPCPRCGSAPKTVIAVPTAYICSKAMSCDARLYTIEQWNLRAPDPKIRQLVKAVRYLLDFTGPKIELYEAMDRVSDKLSKLSDALADLPPEYRRE